MQLLEGELVLSPSDLTGFAACAHLSELNLLVARGELARPEHHDPELEIISRAGDTHEGKVLAGFRAEGRSVVEVAYDGSSLADLRDAEAKTLVAMQSGADVVYQATFFDGRWRGHADFLLRVEEPSELGSWSYEVADAKLARRVKAAALLQMSAYSEQVERLQGRAPTSMHVLTGDGERHAFRVAEYSAYFRTLKAEYEARVLGPPTQSYPDKVEHCGICRWSERCDDQRRTDDHLSTVGGMRSDQIRKLNAVGITTAAELAAAPAGLRVAGIGAVTGERLRRQAVLQLRGADADVPVFERLAAEVAEIGGSRRGLAGLPEPSPGDLFFDMEGDPFATEGGLEYLFGVIELVAGEPKYHAFWGHDRAGEKRAFEDFMDFVADRRSDDPGLHIYHYAPYEPSAVKRLMGLHGTREDQVDGLLRDSVFVDLYRVLKQSVQVSTDSYSLKKIEALYMERASGEVMNAASSIVAYEEYLEVGDPELLESIAKYNEADCESTRLLRDWLEARRSEAEQELGPIARPEARVAVESESVAAESDEVAVLVTTLGGDAGPDSSRNEEEHAAWLLAQLLRWHQREDKPEWWAYFDRVERGSEEDLVADAECIGALEYEGEVGRIKDSIVHRYRFPAQDHKFSAGDKAVDPATTSGAGEVVTVDNANATIDLKRGLRSTSPHPRALIPPGPYDNKKHRAAIRAVAVWVAEHGIDAPGPFRAVRDLLLRRAPATQAVLALDQECLAIQGPPGSGKTYTGARMIVGLLDAGRTVGITAHTHAAIGQLLREVVKVAGEQQVTCRALQKCKAKQHCGDHRVQSTDDQGELEVALEAGGVNLIAGTPWLWSREEMIGSVDTLFVDEAGQMALANVVAVAAAMNNLVLLGDPQQLAQPSKGSHPIGAGRSALEHLLGEHDTIPPELGMFLDTTFRMHPDVCAFVSEVAYEDRLRSVPGLEQQRVTSSDAALTGSGVRFFPVEHAGNRIASTEEAVAVGAVVDALLGGSWTNRLGETRALTLDDVLVVAPYNAHVARLRTELGPDVRVGTVDKFQGQEAPVAIYSMATSSAADISRTIEFLYDLHRANVAVSRARALSVLVCSPALLRVHCHNPEQMRLVNALCRYVELAGNRSAAG